MSSELRLKKLRGSGGYVMASVSDEQPSYKIIRYR